jgi:mono/diheme cytochrome c family protein
MKSLVVLFCFTSCVLPLVVGCGTPDPVLPPAPVVDLDRAAQRGAELVNGFGACGFCHSMDGLTTSPLSGGRLMSDVFGAVRGPNITRAATGIGEWTEVDFKKALRTNIRPDGSEVSSQLHRGFEWLADTDLTALVAYLRTVAPLDQEISARRTSLVERNTTGFLESRIEVKGYIPALGPQFRVEYGQYVTDHVARCGSCHTKPGGWIASEEYLAGGREVSFDGEYKVAPNITTSKTAGIGSWSEFEVGEYLRSGKTPAGREVNSKFCPVQFYAKAPQEQINAVVAYLRTVPAVD